MLGEWEAAFADLNKGQLCDYDDKTQEILKFVKSKVEPLLERKHKLEQRERKKKEDAEIKRREEIRKANAEARAREEAAKMEDVC